MVEPVASLVELVASLVEPVASLVELVETLRPPSVELVEIAAAVGRACRDHVAPVGRLGSLGTDEIRQIVDHVTRSASATP